MGWLRRIAVNTFLNSRRSKVRGITSRFADMETEPQPSAHELSPDRASEQRDLGGLIESALDGLSDRERAAFVLRHYQDRSMQEIADAMDVAVGTVKSLLFRSTRKMRTALAPVREDWRGTA